MQICPENLENALNSKRTQNSGKIPVMWFVLSIVVELLILATLLRLKSIIDR